MTRRRLGYTMLLYLLLPAALWHLAWRARRQPAYLQRIPERFGYYRQRAGSPLIWIHAVSVGETRAAEPLVRALRKDHPGHGILVSHMTPTGRETGEALFGDSVDRCYLPYDFPRSVARFLDHYRPTMALLMETELWPNLIHGCRVRDIPVYLVNARLSGKSHAGYRRFEGLMRETLGEITGIAAQGPDDAQRLAALGAGNVVVTGNLKFDLEPPPEQLALGASWRRQYGAARRVLLAASTREGEESLLIEHLRRLDVDNALLVIVPRHPQRFDAAAALLERGGLRYQRRSANVPVDARTQVLLGDSMGELPAYYAACDVAFVGGSLLPLGGQNMIEACAVGKPVLFGPHTFNFSEAAENAVAAGAACRVKNVDELMVQARQLLIDKVIAQRMGQAGIDFVKAHQGATKRVLELLAGSETTSARARR
ncbi:MAG: lipid IV(A) 3-deoxy-D-manno-octulosonic acid transferase [Betaproteobacteria bacterium]